MADPLPISVVIPAYNAAETLAETLASVAAQTCPPSEIVVVDDGSTDDTAALARQLGARVVQQTNRGLSAARNAGIRAASQPWIALLDSDDLWAPTKLAHQWRAVTAHPDVGIVATDHAQFFEDGSPEVPSVLTTMGETYRVLGGQVREAGVRYFPDIREQIHAAGHFLIPSTILARRQLLVDAGLFDESFRIVEDVECFLRLVNRAPLAVVEEPLMRYRVRATSLSRSYLRMLRGMIQLHDVMDAKQEAYPPHVLGVFQRALPGRLREAGVLLLESGATADARPLLRRALLASPSPKNAAILMLAWMPAPLRRRLVAAYRRRAPAA
ncbi:glycosyltransferase family 2 protein [Roseisolibacter agri]|uniref:Glycosyltransferase 2-like domain-containing protein n=1 Tax=Roseisolibacter agri TaxID=2014610 RepID=A0AA37Q6F3_9BACT|nr:glycosyltransferase family 2 protein [Roseisolibacter agri]GLC27159.1 hypothetical protein rosag_36720 [Roseisolibacter agri]